MRRPDGWPASADRGDADRVRCGRYSTAMTIPPITSTRLDLVPMSPEFLTAVLEGERERASALLGCPLPEGWPGDAGPLLRMRLEQMRRDPAAAPWLLRALVLREPQRAMVGRINFHGPPSPDGWVEIGYTTHPEHRRRGYAEEATRALFDWAAREHGVRRVRASVSPTNEPSLALVRKLGLVQTGTQWDEEDGEELVFEGDWPPA